MIRAVFNQKGGVGKTTIVCNLAAVAAARGLRTLVVDLDMQANATRYLLGSDKPESGIADFFASTLAISSPMPRDAPVTRILLVIQDAPAPAAKGRGVDDQAASSRST